MTVVQAEAQAKRQARVASKFKKKGLHSLTTDDVTVILEQVYILGGRGGEGFVVLGKFAMLCGIVIDCIDRARLLVCLRLGSSQWL